jgi:hypothetical protein
MMPCESRPSLKALLIAGMFLIGSLNILSTMLVTTQLPGLQKLPELAALTTTTHHEPYRSHQKEQVIVDDDDDDDDLALMAKVWKRLLQPKHKNSANNIKSFVNAIHASQSFNDDGATTTTTTTTTTEYVTLTTHATAGKLDRLLLQLQRWNGPTSAAIYMNRIEDIDIFCDFYRLHKDDLGFVSFHILIETTTSSSDDPPPPPPLYPHNILRNLALDHVPSDYFLALDVDFIPNADCFPQLQRMLQSDPTIQAQLLKKTLFVLPAFERFVEYDKEPLPNTKKELLSILKEDRTPKIAPFHMKKYRHGHRPTNFTRWMEMEEEQQDSADDGRSLSSKNNYPIVYHGGFEPYVVGLRQSAPRYWPYFRGFGFNKVSWIMEARAAGHSFAVLRDSFVLHLNHPQNRKQSVIAARAMIRFVDYLDAAYGNQPELNGVGWKATAEDIIEELEGSKDE